MDGSQSHSPVSPIDIHQSSTVEIMNFDAKESPSLNIQTITNDDDEDCLDFDHIVRQSTLRKLSQLNDFPAENGQIFMGGYIVNHKIFLKLFIDKFTWVTIPINSKLTANDAIRILCKKRCMSYAPNMQLYCASKPIPGTSNIMNILENIADQKIQLVYNTTTPSTKRMLKSSSTALLMNLSTKSKLLSKMSKRRSSKKSKRKRNKSTIGHLIRNYSHSQPNLLPTLNAGYYRASCGNLSEIIDGYQQSPIILDYHFGAISDDDESDGSTNLTSIGPYCTSLTPQPFSKSNRSNINSHQTSGLVNLSVLNRFTVTENADDIQHNNVLMSMEERLLEFHSEEYLVTKINQRNRHQKRILRLTAYGVENLRPSYKPTLLGFHFNDRKEEISSFYPWENITNCYLEDSKTLRISYRDYKLGDRIYQSNEANVIFESIQKRLIIIKEQKLFNKRQEICVGFQKKIMHQSKEHLFQRQISKSVNKPMKKEYEMGDYVRLTRNRSGHILYKGVVHFMLGIFFGIELDLNFDGEHDGRYDGIRYFQTGQDRGVLVTESQILRKCEKSVSSNRFRSCTDIKKVENEGNAALININSNVMELNIASHEQSNQSSHVIKLMGAETVEDTIIKQLKQIILASDTIEGRYRCNFGLKFHKHIKNEQLLEMVRNFMDAVKNKMMDAHAKKYIKFLEESQMYLETKKELLSVEEKCNLESRVYDTVSGLMESAIEQTILQLHIKTIMKLCEEKTVDETRVLRLKMDKLQNKDQSFFEIKKKLQSATNWNRAVYEISLLRDCYLPSEKIATLVNTAHAIYTSYEMEQKEKRRLKLLQIVEIKVGLLQMKSVGGDEKEMYEDQEFITGDDFLPIVIFVLTQASKISLALTDADLLFMEGLVDPSAGRSEAGYYLAVFHAALQWIRTNA